MIQADKLYNCPSYDLLGSRHHMSSKNMYTRQASKLTVTEYLIGGNALEDDRGPSGEDHPLSRLCEWVSRSINATPHDENSSAAMVGSSAGMDEADPNRHWVSQAVCDIYVAC